MSVAPEHPILALAKACAMLAQRRLTSESAEYSLESQSHDDVRKYDAIH